MLNYVLKRLNKWARDVELIGMVEVRKIPGYHDEPLKGARKGQRSIRLTSSYRAFYTESQEEGLNVIWVKEVNKHDYK
jgi:proteic killer suppression protein